MMHKYIDRDTVLRCIKEQRESIDWGQIEDGDAFLYYSACLYRTIASAECIPAADGVEQKIGTWIEIRRNDINPLTGKCGVYVGCSKCGAPLPTDSMLDFIDESDCKFCYNCGAKMEGVRNDA